MSNCIQMKKLSAIFLFIIVATVTNSIFAQTYNRTFSKAALTEDLAIMRKHLETVHAGLYCYTTKAELDQAFETLESKLYDSMTDLEFYRLLAPLQAQIQNGHTMVIPSESWSRYKVDSLGLFPFEVYWNAGRLHVLKNLSDDLSITAGTEILSINGQSVSAVVEQLLGSITRDGKNITYPTRLMNLGFEHWYADIIGTPSQYQLVIRKSNNKKTEKVIIDALSESDINKHHLVRFDAPRVAWFAREDPRKLSLSIDGKTARLTVPTFDDEAKSDNGKKKKQFYKWAFAAIKDAQVEDLILDLRDNGGGDPKHQLALLHHLIDEPLKLYKQTYSITRSIPDAAYYPYDKIKTLNLLAKLALKKEGNIYTENGNFFARLGGAPSRKPKRPAKDIFRGDLYVLIDGGSFSATGEAAGILKDRNRGIFIGEETGGSDFQNTSGRMPMLQLPNSGVRIRLGLLAFKLNVGGDNDGLGVIPDHEVRNTIEDMLNGRDAAMEYTLDLIEANN